MPVQEGGNEIQLNGVRIQRTNMIRGAARCCCQTQEVRRILIAAFPDVSSWESESSMCAPWRSLTYSNWHGEGCVTI